MSVFRRTGGVSGAAILKVLFILYKRTICKLYLYFSRRQGGVSGVEDIFGEGNVLILIYN
jgi:hypothetical protein